MGHMPIVLCAMKKYTFILALVLGTVACNETIESPKEGNPNLHDFIHNLESSERTLITEQKEIISNTILDIRYKEKPKKKKIKIRFTHGSPCNKSVGICVIIPLGLANEPVGEGFDEAHLAFIGGHKVLLTSENLAKGLTSDGYLPILNDVYIDETNSIKAGIYPALFDSERNKYSEVVLDLL